VTRQFSALVLILIALAAQQNTPVQIFKEIVTGILASHEGLSETHVLKITYFVSPKLSQIADICNIF